MRFSQVVLGLYCNRMRAAEHAPRSPLRILERRHGLAEIVEGGAVVQVERPRVNPPRLIHEDTTATLANLREAATTLEEIVPTARRVFGGEHPLAKGTELSLQNTRAALRARETPTSA